MFNQAIGMCDNYFQWIKLESKKYPKHLKREAQQQQSPFMKKKKANKANITTYEVENKANASQLTTL